MTRENKPQLVTPVFIKTTLGPPISLVMTQDVSKVENGKTKIPRSHQRLVPGFSVEE